MKKQTAPSTTTQRRQSRSRSKARQQEAIAATLTSLNEIKPATSQTANVIKLLRSWLTDESGYDEQTWPKLKKALNEERDRTRGRRL